MRWTALGHAGWLAEAAGLRLLFDPLLSATHHGGVYELVDRPQVHTEALRPDFVFVSHRHPDHFDVRSLHALAQADPETVVVTPDALVGWAAQQVGFSDVRIVPPAQRIALDGVTVVTTPSLDAREWGAMVAADDAVVWNQVDTVFVDAAAVRRMLGQSLAAVGQARVTLALVRWQPMLEIAAALGRATDFPYRDYEAVLQQVAAIGAVAVVPSACGARHVGPFAWLDRHVFPVARARFVADASQACPGTAVLEAAPGTCLEVGAGAVDHCAPRGALLVTPGPPSEDPYQFDPFAIPPLSDPNPHDHAVPAMRREVGRWIKCELRPALTRMQHEVAGGTSLRCVVRVVFPDVVDAYTITVGPGVATCERRDDAQWDLRNEIAGSLLWEVIAGRRHWGDVLLAGALRARTRAYAVRPGGLSRLEIGETFLYYALSYDRSVEQAVRWEVARLTGGA